MRISGFLYREALCVTPIYDYGYVCPMYGMADICEVKIMRLSTSQYDFSIHNNINSNSLMCGDTEGAIEIKCIIKCKDIDVCWSER